MTYSKFPLIRNHFFGYSLLFFVFYYFILCFIWKCTPVSYTRGFLIFGNPLHYYHEVSPNRHMDQESKHYENWRQLNVIWRHQRIFLLFTAASTKNSQFSTILMMFIHLKTNSAKFAHYSFLTFSPWCKIPFSEPNIKRGIEAISLALNNNSSCLVLSNPSIFYCAQQSIDVYTYIWVASSYWPVFNEPLGSLFSWWQHYGSKNAITLWLLVYVIDLFFSYGSALSIVL